MIPWFLIPKEIDAVAWAGKVHVRRGRLITPDLLAHEEVHLKQQRAMGRWLWLLRYLTDRSFRMSQEVEAFRVQVKHGLEEWEAARMLAEHYGLELTVRRAYTEITGEALP